MTTFQDPPLQSRRAARQGANPESSTSFAGPQVPRTAPGAGEPLNYVTQNRAPLPGYDAAASAQAATPAPAARGRRAAPPADAGVSPAGYRQRDFSPEARSAPADWTPDLDRNGASATGMVDYQTQARASVFPGASGSVAASLASEPVGEETLSRRELRALREAQGLSGASGAETSGFAQPEQPGMPQQFAGTLNPAQPTDFGAPQQYAAASQTVSAPRQAPAPAPSTQLDSAMAEFDALSGRTLDPRPPATPPRRAGRRAAAQVAPEDGVGAFEALYGQPGQPEQPAGYAQQPAPQPSYPEQTQYAQPVQFPPQPQAYPQQAQQPMAQPQQAQPQQAPYPSDPQGQYPQAVQFPQPGAGQPLVEQPIALQPEAPAKPERPAGHWTNQADDEAQVLETTITRTVGSGALTTSALVLPALPGHNMTTGEVMLTDSISLPSTFAATGAHTPLDESDIDHLLDPGDHQLVNTDSVPIRAIRAVSSHTSSRNLIAAAKPNRGNRGLTALIVSSSIMVVVVVSLLIVAIIADVL